MDLVNWKLLDFSKNSSDLLLTISLSVGLTVVRYSLQENVKGFAESKKISNAHKYSESAWKFVYYLIVWIWGMYLTIPQDFFWDTYLCIKDYPNIPMDENLRLYYLLQLSFYISSLVCHVTIEVRRKDFYQMFFHHVVTILLISMSYYMQTHRYGLVLLILHDCNDVLLEFGKMFIYAEWRKVGDTCFLFLILLWFSTRIVLYPVKVLYSSIYLSWPVVLRTGYYGYWAAINIFLLAIQALNLMWFVMMCRLVKRVVTTKQNVHDDRED